MATNSGDPLEGRQENFLDKPLPSSEDSERAILGAILLDALLLTGVSVQLVPEDFYNPLHRRIYAAMLSLLAKGSKIDPIFIGEELELGGGSTASVGGVAAITNLTYGLPHFTDLADYVRVVREKAQLRLVIRACNETVKDILEGDDPPEVMLEAAETRVTKAAGYSKATDQLITWADQAEREAQDVYDKLDSGDIVTVPSGFPEIDNILYGGGFWGGDMVVLSGATSGGKTTMGLNMADNAAERGTGVLYFTMEMKTFKVFSRVHSAKAQVPAYKIRPHMTERHGEKIRKTLRDTGYKIARLPIGFVDNMRDLESMSRVSKYAVHEKGVGLIIMDYMGLMSPSKNFKGSPYTRASMVSEGIKELAMKLDTPIVALSQLRRKYKEEKSAAQVIEGNEVEPTLDMLKESGSIENDADTVIFLWGEKAKEGEELAIRDIRGKIAKQRSGKIDRFELKFAPDIFKFTSERILYMNKDREPSF